MAFNVRFLTPGAELAVKVGDSVLKKMEATPVGVRQRIRVPIDFGTIYCDESLAASR